MIQALTKRESGADNASALVQVQRENNNDMEHFILIKYQLPTFFSWSIS